MLWYAQSLAAEREDDFKYNMSMAEYLASFWNAEAVQNIRSQREMREDERFATDEQFEQQIKERDFLESDKLIQSIKDKYKNTNLESNDKERDRIVRSPKDMTNLFKIIKDR